MIEVRKLPAIWTTVCS